MADWQQRYEAAVAEAEAARVQWTVAESAMAVANFRRDKAEREQARLFQERMGRVKGEG